MNDSSFALYVVLTGVYVVGFIALTAYASTLHKRLKLIEQEAERMKQEAERIRLLKRLTNPSTHKSEPTAPLLGVVSPKDQDFKDMLI